MLPCRMTNFMQQMNNRLFFSLIIFFGILLSCPAQSLSEVTGFGSNPGNLKMLAYVSPSVQQNAGIVVVLHGCSQSASICADNTGWNKLAEKYNLIIVYPEQQYLNNTGYCFNWFTPADQSRTGGEAESVYQMVDYIKTNYSIDNEKVFVAGLSAGAGMTSIMLATYPDVFHAGAVMSGGAYKSATDYVEAYSVMNGLVDKTPQQWADLVYSGYPGFSGKYPAVAVFHGELDNVVLVQNMTEVMEQWTEVHGADQNPEVETANFSGVSGITMKSYKDSTDTEVVRTYSFADMYHALSINPGDCPYEGGSTAAYAIDKNFHSTWWAARFFGLIAEISVSGPNIASPGETGLIFSVPQNSGNQYQWNVPVDASIVSGQGTSQIEVTWGIQAGSVGIVVTDSAGCVFPESAVFVDLATGNEWIAENRLKVYPNPCHEEITILNPAGEGVYEICSVQGGLVQRGEVKGNRTNIPIGFAKGIYFIKILAKSGIHVEKLVVQ